jgi:hypothetical protein
MYLINTSYLPDGEYLTAGKLKWHEKIRLAGCKWLYLSVKKPYIMEAKTTTGSNNTYPLPDFHK